MQNHSVEQGRLQLVINSNETYTHDEEQELVKNT